jgi:hypothetical protein
VLRQQPSKDNMDAAADTLRSEMPSSFVDLFEKSLARTKDMHHKMAAVFEHSTEAFEEAMSCATRGSAECRVKLMEIARQNANTAFDLARGVFEAKSPAEALELTLAHQRKQFELAATQLKEPFGADAESRDRDHRADPPRHDRAVPAGELTSENSGRCVFRPDCIVHAIWRLTPAASNRLNFCTRCPVFTSAV